MLPEVIENAVKKQLSTTFGTEVSILSSQSLSGGSINEAYKLETSAGNFFMKYNYANRFPFMFEKEAKGLSLLKKTGEIPVPTVVSHGQAGDYSFLILNYIDSSVKSNDFWDDFGTSLAGLHKHFGDSFGLDHDNYIGSLYQCNNQHEDWNSFFIEERLERQMKLAMDSGLVGRSLIAGFERLFTRLPEIFPVEPSSLIHGDLWSGNYMVNEKGRACIIDPAVYYGHREMDIGMSRLFGVFGKGFYEAYNREYPMQPGWRERIEICNLYPLMVHVNLFGQGYVGSVQSILSKFKKF